MVNKPLLASIPYSELSLCGHKTSWKNYKYSEKLDFSTNTKKLVILFQLPALAKMYDYAL